MNNSLNNNKTVDDNTYANYEVGAESEMTYANCEATAETEVTKLQKNESNLHCIIGKKSLAEQLREQLILRDAQKPALVPKPEIISTNRDSLRKRQPQSSFLHTKGSLKQNGGNDVQSKLSISILKIYY